MKERLDNLQSVVLECGRYARSRQHGIGRSYKSDGTVLTEVDLEVSKRLLEAINSLFPDANVVTEEVDVGGFDRDAEYTFVFDPIDGTDPYSQGFPMWCIGVGILDRSRRPVGGMVYAPRFGSGEEDLFLRTDPGDDEVYLNGQVLDLSAFRNGSKDVPHQVTTGSGTLTEVPFAKSRVHFRSFGCSILHIVSVVVFSAIDGCLDPRCYVWDIAPAHAIVLRAGVDFQYWDGEEFSYTDEILLERKKFKRSLVVGTRPWRDEMMRRLAE